MWLGISGTSMSYFILFFPTYYKWDFLGQLGPAFSHFFLSNKKQEFPGKTGTSHFLKQKWDLKLYDENGNKWTKNIELKILFVEIWKQETHAHLMLVQEYMEGKQITENVCWFVVPDSELCLRSVGEFLLLSSIS